MVLQGYLELRVRPIDLRLANVCVPNGFRTIERVAEVRGPLGWPGTFCVTLRYNMGST